MSSSVIAVRDGDHLNQELKNNNDNLVVLEFVGSASKYHDTCEFMKKFVEKIASNKKGEAYFYAADVDSNNELKQYADKAKVEAMPYFLVFKGGRTLKKFVATKEDDLVNGINEAITAITNKTKNG